MVWWWLWLTTLWVCARYYLCLERDLVFVRTLAPCRILDMDRRLRAVLDRRRPRWLEVDTLRKTRRARDTRAG